MSDAPNAIWIDLELPAAVGDDDLGGQPRQRHVATGERVMDDLIDKLRGIEISVVRANRALLGTTPVTRANELVRASADRIEAQEALIREAAEALEYLAGENTDDVMVALAGNPTRTTAVFDAARATLAKLRAHLGEKE